MEDTPMTRTGIDLKSTENIYFDFEGTDGNLYVVANDEGYKELQETDMIDFQWVLDDDSYKNITYLYRKILPKEGSYMLLVNAKQETFTKIYKNRN